MKRLLVFLCLLAGMAAVDMTPVDLDALRTDSIHVTVSGACEEQEVELPLYATTQDLLEVIEPDDDADLSVLNPATVLKDHDTVSIPQKLPDQPRISINYADHDTLCQLSGVGPSTADAIIAYREEHGLFQKLEDLMNVRGIGEKKFNAIKDQISL